jgi:hypothetical protein
MKYIFPLTSWIIKAGFVLFAAQVHVVLLIFLFAVVFGLR